jgi:hypothetical protein
LNILQFLQIMCTVHMNQVFWCSHKYLRCKSGYTDGHNLWVITCYLMSPFTVAEKFVVLAWYCHAWSYNASPLMLIL